MEITFYVAGIFCYVTVTKTTARNLWNLLTYSAIIWYSGPRRVSIYDELMQWIKLTKLRIITIHRLIFNAIHYLACSIEHSKHDGMFLRAERISLPQLSSKIFCFY